MAFAVRLYSFYEGKPCTRCKAPFHVGQAIERCLLTNAEYRGRNVFGFKHAYAKDCAPRAQGTTSQRTLARANPQT